MMTGNQGIKISDDQNSLKAGVRGPMLIEDFRVREKITHFDHEPQTSVGALPRVRHARRRIMLGGGYPRGPTRFGLLELAGASRLRKLDPQPRATGAG
jgi:hypothetical protein